jgi:hypothetical protein
MIDMKKLAEAFKSGSRFLDDDETVLLGSAVETIALEKKAGRLEGFESIDEKGIVLLGAAVMDDVLRSVST